MFDVKITDNNGQELDIAVDVRFAKNMIEITIDETPEVIEEIKAKGEYIYIQILSPLGIFGQTKLVEFEIALELHGQNQSNRLNAVVGR